MARAARRRSSSSAVRPTLGTGARCCTRCRRGARCRACGARLKTFVAVAARARFDDEALALGQGAVQGQVVQPRERAHGHAVAPGNAVQRLAGAHAVDDLPLLAAACRFPAGRRARPRAAPSPGAARSPGIFRVSPGATRPPGKSLIFASTAAEVSYCLAIAARVSLRADRVRSRSARGPPAPRSSAPPRRHPHCRSAPACGAGPPDRSPSG